VGRCRLPRSLGPWGELDSVAHRERGTFASSRIARAQPPPPTPPQLPVPSRWITETLFGGLSIYPTKDSVSGPLLALYALLWSLKASPNSLYSVPFIVLILQIISIPLEMSFQRLVTHELDAKRLMCVCVCPSSGLSLHIGLPPPPPPADLFNPVFFLTETVSAAILLPVACKRHFLCVSLTGQTNWVTCSGWMCECHCV